jgi:hypothetical protein
MGDSARPRGGLSERDLFRLGLVAGKWAGRVRDARDASGSTWEPSEATIVTDTWVGRRNEKIRRCTEAEQIGWIRKSETTKGGVVLSLLPVPVLELVLPVKLLPLRKLILDLLILFLEGLLHIAAILLPSPFRNLLLTPPFFWAWRRV